jgi:hypothetical protein
MQLHLSLFDEDQGSPASSAFWVSWTQTKMALLRNKKNVFLIQGKGK